MAETSSIITAALGITGTLVGAAIGAYASIKGQSIQTERETVAACVASIDKKEELIRSRAEAFLLAMSDEISFFREHNEFELREAREKIAPLQRAAFSLSAYAGPNLALKSLGVVTASDAALTPENAQQLQSAINGIFKSTSEWDPAFRAELSELKQQRAACQKQSQ
ncbi:MAG: hypothetical protein ACK4MG_02060 [Aquabacterium sp.]